MVGWEPCREVEICWPEFVKARVILNFLLLLSLVVLAKTWPPRDILPLSITYSPYSLPSRPLLQAVTITALGMLTNRLCPAWRSASTVSAIARLLFADWKCAQRCRCRRHEAVSLCRRRTPAAPTCRAPASTPSTRYPPSDASSPTWITMSASQSIAWSMTICCSDDRMTPMLTCLVSTTGNTLACF